MIVSAIAPKDRLKSSLAPRSYSYLLVMKFLWMVMSNFGVAYFKDSKEKFMDLNSLMSY